MAIDSTPDEPTEVDAWFKELGGKTKIDWIKAWRTGSIPESLLTSLPAERMPDQLGEWVTRIADKTPNGIRTFGFVEPFNAGLMRISAEWQADVPDV